jgi:RHS repeat-associated protein
VRTRVRKPARSASSPKSRRRSVQAARELGDLSRTSGRRRLAHRRADGPAWQVFARSNDADPSLGGCERDQVGLEEAAVTSDISADIYRRLTDTGSFDSDGIPETGYIHDGDRWYNPATTAFTTTDPITQLDNPANANPYLYAADNPANNIDPTGQWSWSYFIAGAGILGAAVIGIGVVLTAPITLTALGVYIVAAGIGITGFAAGAAFGCAI